MYSLIKPYRSVAIIGMCKNAGKTTVLNRLISEAQRHDVCLGLTSIGRDGESSDIVTNTKKPEIFVRSGALFATAELTLKLGTVSREILDVTDIPTPMGRIVTARALSDGSIQLAGPSMTVQLACIRDELLGFGAERVIIDGALSRRSLAAPSVTEAAILCTGASYSPDMRHTVSDTAFAAGLLALPSTRLPFQNAAAKFASHTSEGITEYQNVLELVAAVRRESVNGIMIRGAFSETAAASLLTAGRALNGIELVCEDGSRFLLSKNSADKLLRAGMRFSVLHSVNLLAVTVNPFSAYGYHYDKDSFFAAVRDCIPRDIPVINVFDPQTDE